MVMLVMACNMIYVNAVPESAYPDSLSMVPQISAATGSISLTQWQRLNGATVKTNEIQHYPLLLCLLLSGQVELNPGPRPLA